MYLCLGTFVTSFAGFFFINTPYSPLTLARLRRSQFLMQKGVVTLLGVKTLKTDLKSLLKELLYVCGKLAEKRGRFETYKNGAIFTAALTQLKLLGKCCAIKLILGNAEDLTGTFFAILSHFNSASSDSQPPRRSFSRHIQFLPPCYHRTKIFGRRNGHALHHRT